MVDDNAAARDILVHALDGILARVDAVSSGEEAIAAVGQNDSDRPYDVIFMDWRMPGMDGIQATRRIKDNTQLKSQPAVVLVTAFGREDVREEAERIDIDGFLLKPVTTSMLVDTLVTLFAGAKHDKMLARFAGRPPCGPAEGPENSSGGRQRDQPADRGRVAGGSGCDG